MSVRKLLVAWIGHTDLWAMAVDCGSEVLEQVQAAIKSDSRAKAGDLGPVKTLVQQVEFERVELISNYPPSINSSFRRWLGAEAIIHEVSLQDPSSYAHVFGIANRVL